MITLNVSTEALDQLTWEQWEMFDGAGEKINYRKAREIMALFVSDMTRDEAMEALGKLKTSEMKNVFEQFSESIKKLGAVNPTKGGS